MFVSGRKSTIDSHGFVGKVSSAALNPRAAPAEPAAGAANRSDSTEGRARSSEPVMQVCQLHPRTRRGHTREIHPHSRGKKRTRARAEASCATGKPSPATENIRA